MATTIASAAFGAACGSTIVNAAVFTKMAMPEMTRFGYDKRLSAGCIAASGTLASLIPPSILMLIYAVITEQSAGKLLIAGLVPGLLSAAMYLLGIWIWVKRRPEIAPKIDLQITRAEKLAVAARRLGHQLPVRPGHRRHLHGLVRARRWRARSVRSGPS